MSLSKTENEKILKDDDSKALLSIDRAALKHHQIKKRKAEELKLQSAEINTIKDEVSELKDEISEMKDLLKQLLTK